MNKLEIIEKVKALHLPESSYIVFGSCPLAAAGLREANDIDLLVSEDVFLSLQKLGWQRVYKGPKDEPLTHDVYEAHPNWDFSPYSPTLESLLSRATIINGVPFAGLRDVRQWKVASGRPKDQSDIALIDEYLARQPQ